MQRRKFLGLSMVTALAIPFSLGAMDYRVEKPEMWIAKSVEDAIQALYGEVELEETKKISLTLPKVAGNGSKVTVKIKASLPLNSLALFQDTNPESAVAVFSVHSAEELHYTVNIKMAKSGTIFLVAEGDDGKYYRVAKALEVAQTSCEGA